MKQLALGLAALAAAMVAAYLVRRPALTPATRLWLLLAVGLFPLGAAVAGNVAGYRHMQRREFCASCHEMEPYTGPAADPGAVGLAALHSRNAAFGGASCYACHRDYALFGTVTTKLAGLRHLWASYTRDPDRPIALYRPYPNDTCIRCHSTRLPSFAAVPAHGALAADLRAGAVGCAMPGCHGPAHPEAARREPP